MKEIFLCSYFTEVAALLPQSVPTSLCGKTVAFIPTASIHEDFNQYVEEGREALVSLGLTIKELEITQCEQKEIETVLRNCDCIYVSGGNTFFLMQELRRTGTDRLIVEQVEEGKLYIGESAGAMVFAPNIEYAKKMDNHLSMTPGFNDFTALGIVNFYPVVHFKSYPFEESTQTVIRENRHLLLKPITNKQAIVVIGDTISIQSKR